MAAVVEVAGRGSLALFQPVLYSQDAEQFYEGGFEVMVESYKDSLNHLRAPDATIFLCPVFVVNDVLLVVSLNRAKQQATCGICHVEYGTLVEKFYFYLNNFF